VDLIAGLHGMVKAHQGNNTRSVIHSGGEDLDTGLDIELHWE
jgi:hypothetical protein